MSDRRFLLLWLLVVAVALSIHLGSYPLFDADEGRNGEVGREMAATHDYVMPRLDGMPYLDKPIVYFAAEAAFMEILGPTEVAARLPALLFTFATAAVVFWFARKVWGADDGLIAAIVFLSMPLTLAFSRTVIFDSALSFFIVLAIVGFYLAVESSVDVVIPSVEDRRPRLSGERDSNRRTGEAPVLHALTASRPPEITRGWRILAWAAIACGVLTKGPVAIALPLLVAIPYAIGRKAFRALWSWWGLAVFVAVITPWVWAISLAVPDFLNYVLVTETAQRLTTNALKRSGAPWYFVPYLLGGALPWSIPALFAWRRRAGDAEAMEKPGPSPMLYVALWIVIPFIFFSISQSKRPQYILPILPAVALAVAHFWRDARRATAVRFAAAVLLILGVAIAAAPSIVRHNARVEPGIVSGVEAVAIPMAAVTLAGAVAALVFAQRREIAIAALSLPIIAIPVTANPLLQSIGMRRSAQSLVAQMKPFVKPETQVIGIEAYTGSMSFYLQRTIAVATPDGEEFTSNYIIRHYPRFASDPKSSLRRPEWLEGNLDFCCTPRIYVTRIKDVRAQSQFTSRGMRAIASDGHFVAYGPWRGPNTMR